MSKCTCGVGEVFYSHLHEKTCPVASDPAMKAPEPPEHILQFFAFAHLPEKLQAISKPFGEMADRIVNTLPRNPERTVALRKLLESKDAAVRAFIAKLVLLAVLCGALVPSPTFAIDSIPELLKKGAKQQEKDAKKSGTAASFKLRSGESVECVWLAKVGEVYRYQRRDGRLVETPVADAVDVKGIVLPETPAQSVVVHVMYCDGKSCQPTQKTVSIPAWPGKSQ